MEALQSNDHLVKGYFEKLQSKEADVWYPTPYSWELEAFLSLICLDGRSFLDVGCGAGNLALCASSMGADAAASDISTEAVEATRKHSEKLKLPVLAVQSDGLNFWLSKETRFDVVVCNPPCVDVLSEMPGPDQSAFFNSYLIIDVLDKLQLILKERGCFLSVVSGRRNIEFVKSKFSKEAEPFVLNRKIAISGPFLDDIENLIEIGLVEMVKGNAFWDAYFFAYFKF